MPWSPMLSHWYINVAMSTRAQGNGSHAETTRRHPQGHRCLIRLFNNLSFVEQQLNYISHDHRHAITSKVLRASFSEGDPVYRDCDLPSTSSIAAVLLPVRSDRIHHTTTQRWRTLTFIQLVLTRSTLSDRPGRRRGLRPTFNFAGLESVRNDV